MAKQQLVLEEGRAGGQHAAVSTQRSLADAHCHVAEVATQPLPVEGLKKRAREVLQVDVMHRLCCRHLRLLLRDQAAPRPSPAQIGRAHV